MSRIPKQRDLTSHLKRSLSAAAPQLTHAQALQRLICAHNCAASPRRRVAAYWRLSSTAASFCAPICAFRHAGHQHAAAPSWAGTATTGGRSVHQHGPSLPSAMAQPNWAPQRLQVLMARRFQASTSTMEESKGGESRSWSCFLINRFAGKQAVVLRPGLHRRCGNPALGPAPGAFKPSLTDQK